MPRSVDGVWTGPWGGQGSVEGREGSVKGGSGRRSSEGRECRELGEV